MPLPLPNLDTRRWLDLVDEGRALIPRYAPGWTDHNVHDPGITLVELFAWLTELAIYRVNRIPLHHRRKFLSLIGFAPEPPHPARTTLAFTPTGTEAVALPIGLAIAAVSPMRPPLRFRTLAPLQVLPVRLQTVQSFDGKTFTDLTRSWQDGLPFWPWGTHPVTTAPVAAEAAPALYLGFEQAIPQHQPLSLGFRLEGNRVGWEERDRLLSEAQNRAIDCQPPTRSCPPDLLSDSSDDSPPVAEPPPPVPPLAHHSLQTLWEFFNGTDWQALTPDAAIDDTRGFTLNGIVHLTLPGAMVASTEGVVATPSFYLRCHWVSGSPDRAPTLTGIAVNAVVVEQTSPDRSTWAIAGGVSPAAGHPPIPGQIGRLRLSLNAEGAISSLAFNSDRDAPEVLILDYQAATATEPGHLTTTLTRVGLGTGLPHQSVPLPGRAVAQGQIQVWTIAGSTMEQWQLRSALDASRRTDAHVTLDAMQGTLHFGDGEQGRVVPPDAEILAIYDQTAGADGHFSAPVQWQLEGADDALNRAILDPTSAATVTTTAAQIASITAVTPTTGGTAEEELDRAAGRAVEALWAHERLVELCDQTRCSTLDQIDRTAVLNRIAPQRATTLLDFERLALDVPGTQVVRSRAWAGIDPAHPCLQAPGTVTVVIVPELPPGRPQPTAGLLNAVKHYLDRRRVIGTRLLVVGPHYLEVRVEATVQSKAVSDRDRIQANILQALNTFLDPLRGGPSGHGWPFGRDVYRSEILQVIDDVTGVDHVRSLRLIPGTGDAQCGNLCVGPTWLVTPGPHTIEVL